MCLESVVEENHTGEIRAAGEEGGPATVGGRGRLVGGSARGAGGTGGGERGGGAVHGVGGGGGEGIDCGDGLKGWRVGRGSEGNVELGGEGFDFGVVGRGERVRYSDFWLIVLDVRNANL